jgi:kexin
MAAGMYFCKRKHWRSASLARLYTTTPPSIGYEFNELKPDEEEEDDDDDDNDDDDGSSDGRPLLTR